MIFRPIHLLLWLCASAPAIAATGEPDFPTLSGRVIDSAGLLSDQTRMHLTTVLAQHEQATTNQVVVITLRSLGGFDIADYGYRLGRFWRLGQKGRDNGVILLVAPNEKRVRIEVGYGLEGTLTDAQSSTIIAEYILPRFRNAEFEAGIVAGTEAILGVLSGTLEVAATPQGEKIPRKWILLAIVILIILISLSGVGGGGGKRRRRSAIFVPGGFGGGGFGGGGFGGGSFGGGGGSFGGGGASGGW